MFDFLKRVKKKKVHFLHIGKTGGSAIKLALKENLETPKFNIVLHKHNTDLTKIPHGEKIVFFLRDPISRFVSGFYSRLRKGQPRYYFEWSQDEAEVFGVFKTPNELAYALSDDLSCNHSLAIKAMKSVRHLSHYRDWYENMDCFRSRLDDILFIGFQESLNKDFDKLKNILGLPNAVTLSMDNVETHKTPESFDKSIDESAIQALKEYYKTDIEFVDVCKDVMSKR